MHKIFVKFLVFVFLFGQVQNIKKVVLTCGNKDITITKGNPGKGGPIGHPGTNSVPGADGASGDIGTSSVQGVMGFPGAKGEQGSCAENRALLLEMQKKISQLEFQLEELHRTGSNGMTIVYTNSRLLPSDCQGFANNAESGVYSIKINQIMTPVYCDQNTDGEGWIVIQRRINGSQDFFLDWDNYVNGFGNISSEYWLGLNNLYQLTKLRRYELQINLQDWEENERFARYNNFKVGNPESFYRLTAEDYTGDAGGDSMWNHNGKPFTTFDQDHDNDRSGNCANTHHGAWWYDYCVNANLNGRYFGEGLDHWQGIFWWDWKRNSYSLKKTKMMIRPL